MSAPIQRALAPELSVDSASYDVDDSRSNPAYDRIFSRFREHETELHHVKRRVESTETRLSAIEALMASMSGDMQSIKASLQVSQRDRAHITQCLQNLDEAFREHTREEMKRQADHTRATQTLTRTIMWLGTPLLMLVGLILAAIGEGESLLATLIAGFGG
jgi:septal ring factor EnvC (AmiA/AmiB activator)